MALAPHEAPRSRQVEALQAALAARRPNSLPAVLAAAKPSPAEARLVAQLQAEVGALQERLAGAQREHEHVLRGLQQQYERLKLEAGGARERARAEVRGEGVWEVGPLGGGRRSFGRAGEAA
jgi:hypothetical protein